VRVVVADFVGLRVAVRVCVRVRDAVLVLVRVAVLVLVRDAVLVLVRVADGVIRTSVAALRAAAATLIRGIDNGSLFRLSTIILPVERNHPNTWVTEALGEIPFSTAHAPATCGAAIDVPALSP
jgi:hypothetical protein